MSKKCSVDMLYEMRLQQIQSDDRRWCVGRVWQQSTSWIQPAAGCIGSTVGCWWQCAGCKLHAAASDGSTAAATTTTAAAAAAAAGGAAECTDAQADASQCTAATAAAATEQPVRQLSTISVMSCLNTCMNRTVIMTAASIQRVPPTLTVAEV